jgi:hypothetical protein
MLGEITIDLTSFLYSKINKKECIKIKRIHVKVTPEKLCYYYYYYYYYISEPCTFVNKRKMKHHTP